MLQANEWLLHSLIHSMLDNLHRLAKCVTIHDYESNNDPGENKIV